MFGTNAEHEWVNYGNGSQPKNLCCHKNHTSAELVRLYMSWWQRKKTQNGFVFLENIPNLLIFVVLQFSTSVVITQEEKDCKYSKYTAVACRQCHSVQIQNQQ